MAAGDISAIYMGERSEASPIPIPPMILYIMKENTGNVPNTLNISGCHAPNAEIESVAAEIINPTLLPRDLAINPARAPPIIHPVRALETTNPFTESAIA